MCECERPLLSEGTCLRCGRSLALVSGRCYGASPRTADIIRTLRRWPSATLGLRHGGKIDGHSTHENGRQIDPYYPRRDRTLREPPTVAQVDMRLSGEPVRAMLNAGAHQVLIGPDTRIPAPPGVMRWPSHDDHLHTMF